MRLIMMLLLSVGGYHFVSQALDDKPTNQEKTQPVATSSSSLTSWIDSARALMNGVTEQGAAMADGAEAVMSTDALPADTQNKLKAAAKTATDKIHLMGPGCGEPDRYGNLKYCFHDEKNK